MICLILHKHQYIFVITIWHFSLKGRLLWKLIYYLIDFFIYILDKHFLPTFDLIWFDLIWFDLIRLGYLLTYLWPWTTYGSIFWNWDLNIISFWDLYIISFPLMYGLLGKDNIWPRYNYLKIWNLRVQKNQNIEKITFKVVQMKFLAMHITYQKLRFYIFTVENFQNIFMEHDIYFISQWFLA